MQTRNTASSHLREVPVGPRTTRSRPPRTPSTAAFTLPYFQSGSTGQAPITRVSGNMITSETNSLMDPNPSAEVDTTLEDKSQKPIKEDPVPQWVNMKGGIISTQFFEACEDHVTEKRNFFCIDCVLPLCPNCLGSHNKHKQIQVRKYVYRSVVNKKEMHKFVCCRGIQTYSTNNAKVLHLTPKLPQNKSQQNGSKHVCLQCEGSLQEPFLYCCLACKILYEEGRTEELRRDSSILSGSNDTTNDEISGRDEILGSHPETEINGCDETLGSYPENETNGPDEVLDSHPANHNFRPETRRRKQKMPARSPFF